MITTYTLVKARYPDDLDENNIHNNFCDVVLSKKALAELIVEKMINDGFISIEERSSMRPDDFYNSSLLSYRYNKHGLGLIHLNVYIRTFNDDMSPINEKSHRIADDLADEIYEMVRKSFIKHNVIIPKTR